MNVRFMHDPVGVSRMDATNNSRPITIHGTNNKGQPFFGWPFLLVDLVLDGVR